MSRPPLKPVPPEKPLPSDCCDSGCDRCVHDIYAEELAHYEQRLAEWQAAVGGSTDADIEGSREEP